MKCEICGKDFAHLGLHLNYRHKDISQKDYYDKYLKQGGEGFCFTCGNPMKFLGITKGYQHYCNAKCELKDPRISEKARNTYKERTGFDHNMHNPESVQRVKDTTVKNYGGIGFASKELADKVLDTFNNEHGTNITSCHMISHDVKEIEQQRVKTRIKNNGGSYISEEHRNKIIEFSKDPEVIAKRISTRIKNNGIYWTDSMKKKSEQTSLENFGVKNWASDPDNYKKILENRMIKNNGYLSKAEKLFAEMLKNRKIKFEYNYFYKNKLWDFAIFTESSTPELIIEIDGEYNHGLLSDPDGKTVRGYNDCKRFGKLENIKFLVIDSKNIKEGIKETIRLIGIDYNNFIDGIIKQCSISFPYPKYTDLRMKHDYQRLCDCNDIRGTQTYSIITNFHPSIWKCHLKNKPSPFEAWNDKNLLRKCIENRFIYKSVLSSQNVLNGFNICKIAPKISLFNPVIAKYLCKKYMNEFDIIFDPFSGYSGRMIGCCSCGKKYIGQDINGITIDESMKIKEFLNLNSELYCKDIFNSTGTYDCLFTCPPYNDKENWCQEIKNLSCDDWIDTCLLRFKCKKYIFVVDDTIKYKMNIVETIKNKSHFSNNYEKVILIEN